jgi:hypothetical protein
MPCSLMFTHPIPALLEPETLFPLNSVWVSQEVRRSVDGGLSDIQLHRFTTTAL